MATALLMSTLVTEARADMARTDWRTARRGWAATWVPASLEPNCASFITNPDMQDFEGRRARHGRVR
jgi:hypothetical protein